MNHRINTLQTQISLTEREAYLIRENADGIRGLSDNEDLNAALIKIIKMANRILDRFEAHRTWHQREKSDL